MVTGFQLKSAFAFTSRYKAFSNMSNFTCLRKEVDTGLPKPWAWMNFFFGTDYTGVQKTIGLSDTFAEGGKNIMIRRSRQ